MQNEISKVLSSSHLTLIEKENIEPRYINASHLDEFLGKTSEQNSDAHSDEQNSDKENEEKQKRLSSESCEFQEIDKIVESTRQKTPDGKLGEPRFSYADFGTLAHAYLEATVKNKKVEKIEKLLVEISDTENEKRVKSICSICEKMAENFKNSKIGKEALSSSWKRSEFNFTYRVDQSTLKNFYPETKTNIQNEKIMNGSIDLIFQNDDLSYTIVDYKTDKEIENERHYTQLKCYRKVISEMMNCDESKIKCVLYYLRYNQVEDISLKL